jgi:AcrR family transcriptional regulator
VEAAVAVADSEGLGAVSMARVAKELGFTTMSLYRHLTSKDELLQLMWNTSGLDAETLRLEGDGWRERLRHWSVLQRGVLDEHPWINEMPLAQPPVAPKSLHFVERAMEAMDDTGLTDTDKLRMIGLLTSFTLADAKMFHDAKRAAVAAARAAGEGQDAAGAPWTYDALLRELADQETYPRMYRVAWSAGGGEPPDERAEFLFGLDRILDGIQAYIDRPRDRPTGK